MALNGLGVYYGAATSEAASLTDQEVCVVGGGIAASVIYGPPLYAKWKGPGAGALNAKAHAVKYFAAKKGELSVLPGLLDGLDLRGCLISLDALACRPDVAERITARGGDYLLANPPQRSFEFDAGRPRDAGERP